MPSAALQSRISAFESLANPSKSSPTTTNSSVIDLKDWVLDDGSSSFSTSPATTDDEPAMPLPSTRTPTQSIFNSFSNPASPPLINFDSPPKPMPKPKPPALSASSSAKSPIAKAPPLPPRKPSYTSLKSVPSSSSLRSTSSNPPKSAFLYPPNRTDSLSVDQAHTYPPLSPTSDSRSKSHAPASSISSFHSVSLSSDTDISTPESMSNFIATFPMDHASKNSADPDSISLSSSYEDVSVSSLASPTAEHTITMDWEKAMAKRSQLPPQLPRRPSSTVPAPATRSSVKSPPPRPQRIPATTPSSPRLRQSPSLTSLPTAYVPRRVPPPPPSRSSASDRSSIQSTNTSYSFTSISNPSLSRVSSFAAPNPALFKTKRPTPVPSAARKRYEALFNVTVIQRRRAQKQFESDKKKGSSSSLLTPPEARGRRAAGWRGLSVDLITSGDTFPSVKADKEVDAEEVDQTVGPDERLEGKIVKLIWRRSRLEKAKLKDIWSECDPTNTGSLGLDAFVKGMWRIDEELRRAQMQALKSASTASLGSFRSSNTRASWTPMQKSRDILR